MATDYRLALKDRNGKIRKTVELVRKKTRLDKSQIAECLMTYGAARVGEIFPGLDSRSGKQGVGTDERQ